MSLPRKSKLVVSGTDRPRARASAAEASGDSLACSTRPHHHTHSKSKNKIPKSVRYDLENALIGLCDVWFEDIKPHLVRNNIKLHVQGSSASGDYSRPPPARVALPSPPPAQAALPPPPANPELPAVSSGCSHLDPGAAYHPRRAASCAGYSSALPSTARSRSSRQCTPGRAPLSPLLSVPPTPRETPQIQKPNCGANIRKKRRRPHPKPQPSWRVPRLCQTYTVLCRTGAGAGSLMRIASQPPPQPARDNNHRATVPRRVMKNKTTQTEQALCVNKACQSHRPGYRPTTFTLGPNSRDGTFFPPTLPLHKISEFKRPAPTIAEKSPLFQDDLIDIIAASNDKRLKLLYRCSERNDTLSFMNLFPKNRHEKSDLKKIPPWR